MAPPLGSIITLSLLLTASSCVGRDFLVGDQGGWVELPTEPYNDWAKRQRFHVNDTLEFKYNKKVDAAVLWVMSRSHYDACNTTEPLLRLQGGDSRFVLNVTGYYYFIDADSRRCRVGERLIVLVESWNNTASSPVAPPPTPPPQPPKSASAPAAPPAPPKSASAPAATPSSAVALRIGGFLARLAVGGAAILSIV